VSQANQNEPRSDMKRSLLGKETASYEQRCPGSRWLCGRLWMGGRLQDLTRNGYSVTVVQNPTMSLEDDVAYTKRALAAKDACDSRWPLLR